MTAGEYKPSASGERFPTNGRMLLWFLRGSKRFFLASAVFALLISFFELVHPRVVGFTVDSVIGSLEPDLPVSLRRALDVIGGVSFLRTHLWGIAVFILAVALLDAVCRILYRENDARGAETLMQRMRDSLYSHIIRLPFSWHGKHMTGDIIQRCTSDTETIKTFLSEHLVMLIRFTALVTMALVFMFRVSVPLSLVTAAFIPLIVGNSVYFHGKIADLFAQVDIEEGKLSAVAQENLTGVRVVRAFGREAFERKRFEAQNEIFAAKDMRLSKWFCVYWSLGDFLSRFQMFVTVLLGTVFCVRGALTGGQFIEYVAYNMILMWPVRMLGRVISQMSKAGVSISRIRYIMNAEEETDAPDAVLCRADGDIVFDHVSFAHDGGAKVLDDVSVTIRKGETFGILGATGVGKSTIAYLLTRLYDPEAGRITVGGTDLKQTERRSVREKIGMVLQEPYLFSRSLYDNIMIAAKNKRKEEAERAVRTAGLEETVRGFTKGFDTMVGERGVTLSGGEKQRTAIAQMLVRKPAVMVFDDSLSAVDAGTDLRIRRALRTETKGVTAVFISHRITTLMEADHIIVLDHGKIAEEGTHAELLEKNGIYRRIYDLQRQAQGA